MQSSARVSAAIMQMLGNGAGPARARAAPVGAAAACGVWWLALWRLAQRDNNAQKRQSEEASGAVASQWDQQPGRACARPCAGETQKEREGLERREKSRSAALLNMCGMAKSCKIAG